MFYSRPFPPLHASFRVSTSASLLRTCCRAASFNAGASFTIMQNGDLSVQLQSRNNECEHPKASPSHKHLGHVVHRSPALCFHSTTLRTIRTHVWRDAGLSATGRRLSDTRVSMTQGCRVADVLRLQLEVRCSRWIGCSAGRRSCSPTFCTVFFLPFLLFFLCLPTHRASFLSMLSQTGLAADRLWISALLGLTLGTRWPWKQIFHCYFHAAKCLFTLLPLWSCSQVHGETPLPFFYNFASRH